MIDYSIYLKSKKIFMRKILMSLFFIAVSTMAIAQKFKDETGDLSVLSGAKEVNIEYNYSKLTLLKDEIPEAEYIKNRKADLEAKRTGEGDIWVRKWEAAKTTIWQLKFEELLVKTATQDLGISFKENAAKAKYTLIVDVVWIYPGYDVMIKKQEAKVTTVLKIVETANKNKVLYSVRAENAPGDQWGNNFSNESRIGEGFAKTAKSFGKLLKKALK
ncbi:hypothetical protein [Polluticaenibacter yanchengensis]|uniref:DUF4468 domain-containing protein n=1 Tax=Polluticaenibacter yanchengensis TaxID=3014562 RepID=A0ABT4UIX6_9BACT|nr:hypothetical protein [Chitinophagaceae bacterium LY-5]